MRSWIILLSLLASSMAFAEAPTPTQTFKAILNDSGIGNATDIRAIFMDEDEPKSYTYLSFEFNYQDAVYTCGLSVFATLEFKPGIYIVNLLLVRCGDGNGGQVRLLNEYIDKQGANFLRVFYDNNSKFRALNHEEMAFVKRIRNP